MTKKNKKINLIVLFISVILVIFIPFVFDMKTIVSPAEYRGFPFDWIALYPNNGFSFKGLGFLLNVVVFYFLIRLLIKGFRKKTEHS